MRDGWVETSLGEIAEVIGGGTPSTTIPEYWDGEIVWLTPTEITSQDGKVVLDSIRKITDLGFKNSGAQMLPKDSVILTSRASVGYVALAGQELCTNQGFQSLIPKHSVLAKFLMFWIQQNRSEFESRSAGSTFKEISKSNVKSIKIELPPLSEQRRIVDLISSVDSYIEALQQQLESAKKSRNAVLHELLTADGEGWKDMKLSDVTDLITDGSHFSPKTTDTGIPYVTVRDIKDGFLDLDNAARINEESYLELEKNGCRPLPNDILFSKDGTVGKVALVMSGERFVVLSSLAIIRSTKSVILPKFLALTMSSSEFQGNAIGSKTGLAIKRIVLKHLRDLRIKVPTISEQQRIIEIVSEIDSVVALNLKALAETINLRTGLLSDLLGGEHSIPASYDKVIGAS